MGLFELRSVEPLCSFNHNSHPAGWFRTLPLCLLFGQCKYSHLLKPVLQLHLDVLCCSSFLPTGVDLLSSPVTLILLAESSAVCVRRELPSSSTVICCLCSWGCEVRLMEKNHTVVPALSAAEWTWISAVVVLRFPQSSLSSFP